MAIHLEKQRVRVAIVTTEINDQTGELRYSPEKIEEEEAELRRLEREYRVWQGAMRERPKASQGRPKVKPKRGLPMKSNKRRILSEKRVDPTTGKETWVRFIAPRSHVITENLRTKAALTWIYNHTDATPEMRVEAKGVLDSNSFHRSGSRAMEEVGSFSGS